MRAHETITVRISRDAHAALKAAAERDERPISSLLRIIIGTWVKGQAKRDQRGERRAA
jgi:hypothetical protein